jgi:hypothetical protein
LNAVYGWYILCQSVAEFCNCTYFDIMERKALEISALVRIMAAKVEMVKIK